MGPPARKGKDMHADLDRLGLFGELGYISVNDPYKNPSISGSSLQNRVQGKQFLVGPKIERDSFNRVFEGEALNDLVKLRRKWRLDRKQQNISEAPFKPPNAPPKPSGKGSHYGTIEQQFPMRGHEEPPAADDDQDEKDTEVVHAPRNFLVNPPKKGTGYGYAHVTIGEPFEYMSDPYDGYLQHTRKEKQLDRELRAGSTAFVPTPGKIEYFGKFLTLASIEDGEKATSETTEKLKSSDKHKAPWKPASCLGDTLNKYPERIELPPKEQPKIVPKEAKVFRSGGVIKSYPARSIIASNVPKAARHYGFRQ